METNVQRLVTTSELVLEPNYPALDSTLKLVSYPAPRHDRADQAEMNSKELSMLMQTVCEKVHPQSLLLSHDKGLLAVVDLKQTPADLAIAGNDELMRWPRLLNWQELSLWELARLMFNSCAQSLLSEPNDIGRLFITVRENPRSHELIAVEPTVSPSLEIEMRTRTFTQRAFLAERAEKYNDKRELAKLATLPGFIARGDVMRRSHGEKNSYVLRKSRPRRAKKNNIAWMDFTPKNPEKLSQTRLGIFDNLLREIEARYSGLVKIGLRTHAVTNQREVSRSGHYKASVRKATQNQTFAIGYSARGLASNAKALAQALSTESTQAHYAAKTLSPGDWNIVVVPDERTLDDGYDTGGEAAIVQHITATTAEKLTADPAGALAGCIMKELLVKQEVSRKAIRSYAWPALGIRQLVICQPTPIRLKRKDSDSFSYEVRELKINGDGEMEYINNPLEMDIELEGLLRPDGGNLDTDIAAFRMETAAGESVFTIGKVHSTTVPNDLHATIDAQLTGTQLRRKEHWTTALSGLYGICAFERDGRTRYFVGHSRAMNGSLARATTIREITVISGPDPTEKVLAMLDTYMVRYGAPSVLPFPVKYLREFSQLEFGYEGEQMELALEYE